MQARQRLFVGPFCDGDPVLVSEQRRCSRRDTDRSSENHRAGCWGRASRNAVSYWWNRPLVPGGRVRPANPATTGSLSLVPEFGGSTVKEDRASQTREPRTR